MRQIGEVLTGGAGMEASVRRLVEGMDWWTCPGCGAEKSRPRGSREASCECGHGMPWRSRIAAGKVHGLPPRFRKQAFNPRHDRLDLEALKWASSGSLASLVVHGESQTGKSSLAAEVARTRARERGEQWLWEPSALLAMGSFERLEVYIRAEGLVVDDLGLGHDSPGFWARLTAIAVARADAERPTIYTGRLSWRELEKRDASLGNRLRLSRAIWLSLKEPWGGPSRG